MKIWVIGRSYPMTTNRMKGSFELEQAKMLAKYGHEVSYISFTYHPFRKVKKWGYLSWKEDNINIFSFSHIYAPERLYIELGFKKTIQNRILKKIETITGTPDVIHVHYPSMLTDSKGILKYQKLGSRIVCTEHWTKVLTKSINNSQLNRLKDYVENADAFICVGQPLKKSVEELTNIKNKVIVVPNIVNDLFQPNYEYKSENFTFIAVGRAVKVKQFDCIIKAFTKAFPNNENVRLKIVGNGDEFSNLQKLVKELDTNHKIELLGSKGREDVAKLVSKSDCLCCYSKLETFGVPIIEAWACGVPVISSDSLGFAEYWQDGLGQIVDHNNLQDLINSMKYMYSNSQKFDKEKIHQYAIEHFSEKIIVNRLTELYNGR